MYIEEEFEANFIQEISAWTLQFKNHDFESKYMDYKCNKRKVPWWFHWLLWTLVFYFFARRIQTLIFEIIGSPYVLSVSGVRDEFIMIIIGIVCLTAELLCQYIKCMRITKGFWIITMWNIIVPYASYAFYPRTVALLPTGGSAYVFNLLTCTWFIYTWYVSIVSSSIGLILTAVFVSYSGLGICIFLRRR